MKLFKKLPKISKKTIVIASTLVLIVGIPAAYYLWASRQEDTRAWYDSNWAYRRAVQVSNPGSTLTNEDVLISVDTSTLVTAGKLQSDCDDLRFLDSDDTTTLSYWIEDGCNTTDTKVWIRVPSVPNGTKTIYMYYGNPTVSSASLSWGGVVTLFADASCPTGWTRNTDMDGKFLLGSDTYGTTGGSSSHSHSNASCSVSSASGSTAVAPSSGSFSGSTTSHTHSGLTASVGTNSNVLPPYIDSVMCSNNHFTIPTGLISIFNDTAPTGWTRFSAFDSKIPRGGASYGATGGSADHVHTTSGGFTTGSSSGSVSTSSLSTSTGADGAVTISSTTNLNTVNKISGRSCSQGGDAVNYSVTALSANTATVTPSVAAGCLSTGDEVLLINLQGTTSYFSNVGNYETLRVQSVSGTTVTFTTNKTNYYGNGSNDTNIGTSTSNQRVMLQRIPNYTNVTLNGTVHPSPWDGTKGGVIAFKASGTITVSSTGKISADEMGYRGGSGGTTISTTGFGVGAESYCGLNGAGRGGGYGVGYDGAPGICGGGGGGGSVNSSAGSGGAGIARGGGGAGGGQGGGNPARAGAGAGGGYGTGGTGGGGAVTGTSGGTNSSGAGGQGHTSSDAGGGGGGGTYGVANLSKLYLGSGGGGGGGTWSGANGGAGRAGGGIVLVQGDTINVSGNGIKADSYAGFDGTRSGSYYYSGPGGGGAGGSIKIVGNTLSLGSGIVTARGGAGGTSGVTGGTGGYGRIAVQYISSISGTTTPSSNNTQISSSAIASNPHTHVSATNPTTYEGNNLPPIRYVIFGKNDSSKYVTEANILVTNQLPPLGWNRVTDLDNYFPRGSTTYGTTEGSSTHTHEVSIETGGPSLSLTGLGSGYTFAGPSHAHSCVANTNSVSNMPPYISVIYTQRKVSLVTSLEVEETYNKDPNAPSNLLAEGVASPQQVTDTTPEFSAVFSDPDTGDTGVYYEIEVNTASDFTGAVMWDSGKIATTPITNGARSSDISYAGNTLTLDGSTYYWRIRFWDQLDGESPWSTISSFKMNTLPTISNLLTEGTTNPTKVADTTPEFSAICNDSDGDTCNYYEVEVNTSSDFTGTVMWDSGKTAITPVANGARSSDISYAGNTLSLDGSTYYWRMKFWDSIDSESSWSTTASFIMSGAPNQPSDLTVDGQVNPTTLDSLTPTFSAVHTDPNSDDAVYYEIEVNSNSLFSGTVKWDSGKQSVTAIPDGERSTEIAYDGTPLTGGGTTYYWRIRFWDTDDNVSDWSATAQFRDSIAKIRLEGLELEGIKIN